MSPVIVVYLNFKTMRYLSLLLLTISLMLCSCNNNDEPDLEISLPIHEKYLPVSINFNINSLDDAQKRDLIHLVNNEHIINDASELPNDPIGFSDAYTKINFNESTLLIKYLLHDYTIDTYRNRYYLNTKENIYNWSINIGTASDIDVDSDDMFFTRFAILVKKLPSDAHVKTWYGLTQLGWFPESDK